MAQVLEESGDLEGALAHLSNADVVKQLCDPMYVLEKKAELLIKLGRGKEAVNLYDELITCNQENYSYYHGLGTSMSMRNS